MKQSDKFPALYNNHLDIGKSSLLQTKSYGKPDSVLYVDRLTAEYKGKKGFIYFYKYKAKKDDLNWKIATVGLVPEDPKQFFYEESSRPGTAGFVSIYSYDQYYFTGFSDTKLNEDELPADQFRKLLKKMLYSRRKSARNFYEEDNERTSSTDYSE